MSTQHGVLIVGLFGLLAIAHPAHANEPGACREDAQRLCGEVKPGQGHMHDCLKSHEGELSQACKDKMHKMTEKHEEMKQACQADITQYCAAVTPGEGRLWHCLKAYDDKLSADCKAKLQERKGKHKEGMMKHRKERREKKSTKTPG